MVSISIKDSFVADCLAKETNKSGLITSLLYDYYKARICQGTPRQLDLEEINREKERIKGIEDMNAKAVANLTKQEQEILEARTQEENKKKRSDEEVLDTFANYIEHLFVVSKEKARECAKDYFPLKEDIDLYSWCEEQGLVPKNSNDN